MSESNSASGGIGAGGLLGVLFVALKLTDVIDWSWWWVTAPFWGLPAVLLCVGGVCIVIGCALKLCGVRP